jgi:hypothetical protein
MESPEAELIKAGIVTGLYLLNQLLWAISQHNLFNLARYKRWVFFYAELNVAILSVDNRQSSKGVQEEAFKFCGCDDVVEVRFCAHQVK